MVNYVDVESSNVQAVGYEDGTLYVKFNNGSEYTYEGVSEEIFNELKDAPSVGQYLNQNIKGQYTYQKVA